MKKLIKIISFVLSIMCFSIVPIFASETEVMQPRPFYLSFTGTVSEIEKTDDAITKIFLENEDGTQAHFILNENTYYADGVKIEKGLKITGYYESGRPMIFIYPPQYTIDIVTPAYEEGFVKADKFDSDLLSKDKQLKLNISEKTEILWENNTEIKWLAKPSIEDLETVLSNRKLIVYYDVTTRSIPAQTSPKKIVVLSAQIEDKISIIVKDTVIDSPDAYISEAGTVMVPVRAISEALGYEVSWDNDEKRVQVGSNISFKLGEPGYLTEGTAISSEEAPVLNNGHTYVPLNFFKDAVKINTVSFLENNIVINPDSLMSE